MTDAPAPPRRAPAVEIYIDGTNFNHACDREGIAYRVDLNRLAIRLSRGYHFVRLRYYTAPLANRRGAAYRIQQRFFRELRRSRRIELVLGRQAERKDAFGRPYHVEKETDVNLAVDMVVGAYEERFDVAMLVAGDTDYARTIQAVRARGKRVVWCHLPAQAHIVRLAELCDARYALDDKFLRTCALGPPR